MSTAVETLLDQVQLPRAMRNRYPHELSGGQRQRVGIARSLALEPQLLVADEPTSALDVSVQATVLDLFQDLQREHGFACLFISHDLAVVEMLADRIAVMHNGKLVEVGETAQVVNHPQDPYTQRLLAAVPVPDPAAQQARREARDALLEAQRDELERDELAARRTDAENDRRARHHRRRQRADDRPRVLTPQPTAASAVPCGDGARGASVSLLPIPTDVSGMVDLLAETTDTPR